MTSLLARIGQLESRISAQTIWNSGKRKRVDWVCTECQGRSRRDLRQRRGYSDDALRWSGSEREGSSPGGWGMQWEDSGRRMKARDHGRLDDGSSGRAGMKSAERETDQPRVDTTFFDRHELDTVTERKRRVHGGTSRSQAKGESDLWDESEKVQTARTPFHAIEVDDESTETTIPRNTLLDLDYRKELPLALRNKAADVVIRCLYAAAQDHDMDFIASIADDTFSEILRVLEPSSFVAKLGTAHIELSSALAESMHIAPMRDVAFEYNKVLLRILRYRRGTGKLPRLEDYELLLRSARLLGSYKMATIVWRSLHSDGLKPSTKCFNYYMASLVWNGAHSAGGRHKVRVIPFNMMARSAKSRRSRFGAYRIGERGVKEDTMRVFGEMLAFGAVADHDSFQTLITACAREGDINTVKAILQRVWSIDVQAIMDGKDEDTITPISFSENSPLRPQSSLLFALAHAFGVNNDVPSALRVVDFVARHYDLEITTETWNQLFEWTFVLAEERTHDVPESVGKLPSQSVLSLWKTMTGAPYFIKPNLGMYTRLISNLCYRSSSYSTVIVDMMNEALPLVNKDAQAAARSRRRLAAAIKESQSAGAIEEARREWEYASLIKRRNTFWARRWVRNLLTAINSRNIMSAAKHQQLLELPRLLWDWRKYAPTSVHYESATGFVECTMSSREDLQKRAAAYTKIVDDLEQLKRQSKRYVGDGWTANHTISGKERAIKEVARRKKAAIREAKDDRRLISDLRKDNVSSLVS
ncbi:Putative ATPase expression protein 2 [Septoria linicola]|uniref:ATPase expression protein 2 n=1 Tax=Septoria linicola TaxID=215465 RepID=A0A9Q9EHE1_9PEZI|nr:putative ATPase expression protein 2 [Septoria linicola]USW49817.1 Putative ATPase expression protein 2 [Septoria linicola]